jgi:hypothetical protein
MDLCGFYRFDGLKAGKYKWEVKDGMNNSHTYSVELVAPAPATVTLIKSGNFNNCSGVITVSVQGGVLPFSYFWPSHTGITSVLTSVCEESVSLRFSEAGFQCVQFISIQTSPVGLQENSIQSFQIFPNPVADFLELKLLPSVPLEDKISRIFDISGKLILQTDLKSRASKIDVKHLQSGLYFLQIDNYKTQLFLKE